MELKDIEHLAELSKLQFSNEELEQFSKDFESIISLADTIKNYEVSGSRVIEAKDMSELREDVARPSTKVEVLLENSPIVKNDSIVVPRIME